MYFCESISQLVMIFVVFYLQKSVKMLKYLKEEDIHYNKSTCSFRELSLTLNNFLKRPYKVLGTEFCFVLSH